MLEVADALVQVVDLLTEVRALRPERKRESQLKCERRESLSGREEANFLKEILNVIVVGLELGVLVGEVYLTGRELVGDLVEGGVLPLFSDGVEVCGIAKLRKRQRKGGKSQWERALS